MCLYQWGGCPRPPLLLPVFLIGTWWRPVQTVKNLPAMQETWVQSLGWEDSLEKGMATHSSILAWRIPRTEEPSRLKSPWGCKESDTTEWLLLHLTSVSNWGLLLYLGFLPVQDSQVSPHLSSRNSLHVQVFSSYVFLWLASSSFSGLPKVKQLICFHCPQSGSSSLFGIQFICCLEISVFLRSSKLTVLYIAQICIIVS